MLIATRRQVKDLQMSNILLEEQIDDIADKQIISKQDIYNTQRQIGRLMKQTETFLRDSERLVREKLNQTEQLRALLKYTLADRDELKEKRDLALAAT